MGVHLNDPKRLPSATHFCNEEHLAYFLNWRSGDLHPKEVEKLRKNDTPDAWQMTLDLEDEIR